MKDAGKDASHAVDAGRDTGSTRKDAAQTADDAQVEDAGEQEVDAGMIDCSPPSDGVLPRDLRCTGLYKDAANKTIAEGILEYKPAYVLWSDGAEKRRFASIPAGQKIDVSKPDALLFPDGTKFWKEFSVKGTDGKARLAETRLIEKTPDGWLYTSYVWNAEQTQAIQMDNMLGVPAQDVGGSKHIVPTRDQCNECHGGRDDGTLQYFVLGWDAVMLGEGATGVDTLASLTTAPLNAKVPGNEVEQAALGYLHANCGISCHNDNINAKGRDSGLFLRLEAGELSTVQSTDAFKTGMNKVPNVNAKLMGLPTIQGTWLGIRPGQPDRSLLVARQRLRGVDAQMPRIATDIVDQEGVKTIVDWIQAMPTIGGYPTAKP